MIKKSTKITPHTALANRHHSSASTLTPAMALCQVFLPRCLGDMCHKCLCLSPTSKSLILTTARERDGCTSRCNLSKLRCSFHIIAVTKIAFFLTNWNQKHPHKQQPATKKSDSVLMVSNVKCSSET